MKIFIQKIFVFMIFLLPLLTLGVSNIAFGSETPTDQACVVYDKDRNPQTFRDSKGKIITPEKAGNIRLNVNYGKMLGNNVLTGECKSLSEQVSESEQAQSTYPVTYLKAETGILDFIAAIYRFLVALSAFLAGLMIVVNGIKWMFFAAGNSGKIGQAKSGITTAIMGLFIALFSYNLLSWINPALVNLKPPDIKNIVGKEQETSASQSGLWTGVNTCQDESAVYVLVNGSSQDEWQFSQMQCNEIYQNKKTGDKCIGVQRCYKAFSDYQKGDIALPALITSEVNGKCIAGIQALNQPLHFVCRSGDISTGEDPFCASKDETQCGEATQTQVTNFLRDEDPVYGNFSKLSQICVYGPSIPGSQGWCQSVVPLLCNGSKGKIQVSCDGARQVQGNENYNLGLLGTIKPGEAIGCQGNEQKECQESLFTPAVFYRPRNDGGNIQSSVCCVEISNKAVSNPTDTVAMQKFYQGTKKKVRCITKTACHADEVPVKCDFWNTKTGEYEEVESPSSPGQNSICEIKSHRCCLGGMELTTDKIDKSARSVIIGR